MIEMHFIVYMYDKCIIINIQINNIEKKSNIFKNQYYLFEYLLLNALFI